VLAAFYFGRHYGAQVAVAQTLATHQKGYTVGYEAGEQKGIADTSGQLITKYEEGYTKGHEAGEQQGIASVQVLTDKETTTIKSFWSTVKENSNHFVVLAKDRVASTRGPRPRIG
jgi:flagellar biosynthesis/type III secretory pathway protein FliH